MKRSEIVKNILLRLILLLAFIIGGFYAVYHFFGDFPLFVTIFTLYTWFAWQAHKKKRNTINAIVKKSTDEVVTSYDLAVMIREAHRTDPESIEVTKLMDRLVTRLKPLK